MRNFSSDFFLNSFPTILHTHTKRVFKFSPFSFCWISLTQSGYESKKLLNCSSRTAIKHAGRRGHNHQDIKSLWLTPLAKWNSFTRQREHPSPQLNAMGSLLKNGKSQNKETKFIFPASLGAIWGTQFHLNWVKQTELKNFNFLRQVSFENKQFCSRR